MTWWMLQQGVDVQDAAAVAARCHEPVIESGTDPVEPTITVDGTDVVDAIRSAEVTGAVSHVSVVPEVRARLLELQRAIIGASLGEGGIVVEGRDIGSVVWPQADVKLYLAADAAARAARRIAEHAHLGDVDTAEAGLRERDQIDSGRKTAPLMLTEGAVVIDTTDHTLNEVIDQVVTMVTALETPGAQR
jgi:cytidylate kinase